MNPVADYSGGELIQPTDTPLMENVLDKLHDSTSSQTTPSTTHPLRAPEATVAAASPQSTISTACENFRAMQDTHVQRKKDLLVNISQQAHLEAPVSEQETGSQVSNIKKVIDLSAPEFESPSKTNKRISQLVLTERLRSKKPRLSCDECYRRRKKVLILFPYIIEVKKLIMS